MIGAAVVGLGVGEAHARAFADDPRSVLRWVHDHDAGRSASIGEELEAGVATDFEEILADPTVDVVAIASFDDAHFAQALAALRAGKHVFVEKPLCRTEDELMSLHEAWCAAGEPALASNLVLRAAPLYRWLRDEVEAGHLGTPYAFDGDYLYGRLHKILDGWRGHVEDYSVMLGGGVHLVDLLLWTTRQRPRRVAAVGNRIATAGTPFRYDDFVAGTFEFESGLVGRVTANFGCVHAHQHVVRLFGTEGTFLLDDAGARVHRNRDPAAEPDRPTAPAEPTGKGVLVPWFLDLVDHPAQRAAAAGHELSLIAACVAANQSLAERRPVDIRYP